MCADLTPTPEGREANIEIGTCYTAFLIVVSWHWTISPLENPKKLKMANPPKKCQVKFQEKTFKVD